MYTCNVSKQGRDKLHWLTNIVKESTLGVFFLRLPSETTIWTAKKLLCKHLGGEGFGPSF